MKKQFKKLSLLMCFFFIIGTVFLMGALYIPAKAKLAQYLLEEAWQESRLNHQPEPPWPWADTYPIAKMQIPSINMEVIILSGASGRTLAFGPGHISSSVLPGFIGNSLISAHRDTHFQDLDKLKSDDLIYIERADGKQFVFKVKEKRIIATDKETVSLNSDKAQLGLITCYPLQGVQSDPDKRFFIMALIVQNNGYQEDTSLS